MLRAHSPFFSYYINTSIICKCIHRNVFWLYILCLPQLPASWASKMWKHVLMVELTFISCSAMVWVKQEKLHPAELARRETRPRGFNLGFQLCVAKKLVCLNFWKVWLNLALKDPIGMRSKMISIRKCQNICIFSFFSFFFLFASHKWLYQMYSDFTSSPGHTMTLHLSANKLFLQVCGLVVEIRFAIYHSIPQIGGRASVREKLWRSCTSNSTTNCVALKACREGKRKVKPW